MSDTDQDTAALLAAAARAGLEVPPEELSALTAAFALRNRNRAKLWEAQPSGLLPAFTFHPATPVRA